MTIKLSSLIVPFSYKYDLVSDNERVLAYQGLKKTAQEKDINNYISACGYWAGHIL